MKTLKHYLSTNKKKEFSLKEGRAHVEFAQMMSQHKENMTTILEKLQATDIEYSNTFDTNASDNKSDDEKENLPLPSLRHKNIFLNVTKCSKSCMIT